MKKITLTFCLMLMAGAFISCGNKTEGNPEADSLRNVVNAQMRDMDEMTLFLDAVNTSMDSIVNMEGDILRTSGESPISKKEQIMQNLEVYKSVLAKQRERLAVLEEKLKNSDNANAKMLQTITALKKQLEEKDKTIVALSKELEARNFDIQKLKENIAVLNTEVENLNTNVNDLTRDNKAKDATITAQENEMNEAYVLIGTKSELKAAGALSGGSIFKKSKLDMSSVNMNAFRKIDIRNTKSFNVPAKNCDIMTQAPNGSYSIVKNNDGTCTINIIDAKRFWSVSNFLVVKY